MGIMTIEGVYDEGSIQLKERPDGVCRSRVIVTFLPEPTETSGEDLSEVRRTAIERMLARMRRGIDFGGERFDRSSLYTSRIS